MSNKNKENIGYCVVCGKKTKYIMNIEFQKTPICNNCANTIAMQQLHWLSEEVEK